MVKLNKRDKKLLKILDLDARQSNIQIAKKIKIYQRGKLVKQTKGNTMEEFEYNTKERTITRKVTDYDKDKVSKETCYFDQGFSVVKCGKETKGDDGQVVETYEHWESEPLVFGCWNSWLRELWNERKPGIEDLLQ